MKGPNIRVDPSPPTAPRPTRHRRQQIRLARDNGPRGKKDRGKVFVGGRWGIYVGTVIVLRPVREGCFDV